MMMMSRRNGCNECLLWFAHDAMVLHGSLTVAATMIEVIGVIGSCSMGHIDVLQRLVCWPEGAVFQTVPDRCEDCAKGPSVLRWSDSVDQDGYHVR